MKKLNENELSEVSGGATSSSFGFSGEREFKKGEVFIQGTTKYVVFENYKSAVQFTPIYCTVYYYQNGNWKKDNQIRGIMAGVLIQEGNK